MPLTVQNFSERIEKLRGELAVQARRVRTLIEGSFDAVFAQDTGAAKRVIALDEEIDRIDVEIEKASVQLLTETCASGASISAEQVRMLLTIVKVNNELERIADCGVVIAELVKPAIEGANKKPMHIPETVRVITNSLVGILRDATTALDRLDERLARVVLASEDAVEAFKDAIVRDLSAQILAGRMQADNAFLIQEITTQCEIMAGHCTNIAEQALYVASGKIYRHMQGHWEEVR